MLELRGIQAGYGDTTVLRDVTLAVPPSSVVALIGANGAGKTTLLRVASGLLRPDGGRLLLDGDDVTGARPHELAARGVCHVPEGRGIFPSLTVQENLLMQADRSDAHAVERVVDAFPVFGSRLRQVAGTLSGGEQQMLALGRAYAARPRVVLLDEVSMGLAPRIVEEIFGFLERLAGEGASLLLVEQYISQALALADFVYLLSRGGVAACCEPFEFEEEVLLASYLGTGGNR